MHFVGFFAASMDVQNTSRRCLQQYGCRMTNYFPGAANVPIRTHLQLDVGPRRPRAWHMVHPFYCQPDISTECQLIIFGGNAHIKGDSGDREDMADLRILTFGVKSLRNHCLSVIVEAAKDREIQNAEELWTLLPASVPKANKDQIKAAFAAEQNCAAETPRFSKTTVNQ